jgi:hypothetical protein
VSQSEAASAPERYFDFDFDLLDDVDLPRLLELAGFFDLPDLVVLGGVDDEEPLESGESDGL